MAPSSRWWRRMLMASSEVELMETYADGVMRRLNYTSYGFFGSRINGNGIKIECRFFIVILSFQLPSKARTKNHRDRAANANIQPDPPGIENPRLIQKIH